jgi:hypothetical protein
MLLDKTLELLLLEVFLFRLAGAFLTMFLMIISISFSPKRNHDEASRSESAGSNKSETTDFFRVNSYPRGRLKKKADYFFN